MNLYISDLKLTVKNGHSNSSLVTSVGNQLVKHTDASPIPTQLFCFTVSVSNIFLYLVKVLVDEPPLFRSAIKNLAQEA